MIKSIKNNEDALIGMGFLGVLLIFGIGVVVLLSVISIIWGIITIIGALLLCGAAYILLMKKGQVTIAPNSPFTLLLVIGLILVFFGQVVMEIGTVNLNVIPGLEALHNMMHP